MFGRLISRSYFLAVDLLFGLYFFFARVLRLPGHRKRPVKSHLDPILLLTAEELAEKIRRKELTSKKIVETYINRIKKVNKHINAVVATRFEEAISEAEKVDERIRKGEYSAKETPFLGVPCTIKECFALEGMPNTSGLPSRLKTHSKSSFDAIVVIRMKNAGFIPLGVTNTSELCMWYESNNKVYGRTSNPYDIKRMVGGSSGGEACVIAAAGSIVGLGSDIGGSLRMPAFFNGVWSLKPGSHVIPNQGQHPIAENEALGYLCTGPICRYATDLWPMFQIFSDEYYDRKDKKEPTRRPHPKDVNISNLRVYSLTSCKNPLVQKVSQELIDAQSWVEHHLISFCKAKKFEVAKNQLKELDDATNIWSCMLSSAGGSSFSFHLGSEKEVNFLLELGKWALGKSDHTFPAIVLAGVEKIPEKVTPQLVKYYSSLGEKLKKELLQILGNDGILLFPTHPTPAVHHNRPIFTPFNFCYTAIFNVLEVPVVQVPLGLSSEGIPLGIQIVAAPNNEHILVAVALEIERAFGGWVRPPI